MGLVAEYVDVEGSKSCSRSRSTSSLKSPNNSGGDPVKSPGALIGSRRRPSLIMTTGGRVVVSFLTEAVDGCEWDGFLGAVVSGGLLIVGMGSDGFVFVITDEFTLLFVLEFESGDCSSVEVFADETVGHSSR